MALAATLASTGVRPVSFLPTITCSNCAAEIEIAAMGEHICAPAITAPAARKSRSMSNPFRLRKHSAAGRESVSLARAETPGQPSVQSAPARQPRTPLPKINSDVANRAFLTPRETGHDSSRTPGGIAHSGGSSGKAPFSVSLTSPRSRHFDQRPPSPKLTANLDCAFPPFRTHTVGSGRSTPSNGRGTPTGSDRAASRAGSRAQNLEPESIGVEPRSPGIGVMQKFETLRSGPFTARRQGSGASGEGVGASGPEEQHARSNASPAPQAEPTNSVPEASETIRRSPPPRPARLSYEQLSPVLLERFSAEPDSMSPPQSQPAQYDDRNNAFPLSQEHSHRHSPSQSLSKIRSEPSMRHPERKASLGAINFPQAPPTTDASTLIPRRSSSRVGTRIDYRMENAPPVPQPVQQHRKYGTHTPSESGSSTVSSVNTYSSRPSPVSSAASSVEPFSPLSFAANGQEEDKQLRPTGPRPRSPQEPGLRAELPSQKSPPRKFSRPALDRAQKPFIAYQMPLESPVDPALLLGSPCETQQPTTPSPAELVLLATPSISLPGSREPTPISTECSGHGNALSRTGVSPPLTPLTPLTPRAAETQRRKHNCRGCGLMIEGKSVKAADGRMTGRWHRSCFVCRCCDQPFATADFYVINNEPYCEQHYHEQNGSLCHGCHRGIEGQYLETTSTQFQSSEKKFHPRCFTCSTCHEVLSKDYFEVSGSVLCERHALATLRQQQMRLGPASRGMDRRGMFAERRTTRLINPIMA